MIWPLMRDRQKNKCDSEQISAYRQLADIIQASPIVAFSWQADRYRTIEYVSNNSEKIGHSKSR